MSVRAYYDVWCDFVETDGNDCGNWCEQATAMEWEGKRVARKRAAHHGWTYRRGVGDLCPKHSDSNQESGRDT